MDNEIREKFSYRALTALAKAVERRLGELPQGNRRRNLEELFTRELPADGWFDHFCPQEPAPTLGVDPINFSGLYHLWISGEFSNFPAAFQNLVRELEGGK